MQYHKHICRVEWSTLIFFATLFVVMEALDRLGLLSTFKYLTKNHLKT